MISEILNDFFDARDIDDIEQKFSLIFFSGILFSLIVFFLIIESDQSEPTPFIVAIGTFTFILLSISTVATTLLPKMAMENSTSNHAKPAYLVFVVLFNVLVVLLVAVSFVASFTEGLSSQFEKIGGFEATRSIIVASIFFEIIIDVFAFFYIECWGFYEMWDAILQNPIMVLIILTEISLAVLAFYLPVGYLYSPELFLGFILSVGHILAHAAD